jgi:hypothetical protein
MLKITVPKLPAPKLPYRPVLQLGLGMFHEEVPDLPLEMIANYLLETKAYRSLSALSQTSHRADGLYRPYLTRYRKEVLEKDPDFVSPVGTMVWHQAYHLTRENDLPTVVWPDGSVEWRADQGYHLPRLGGRPSHIFAGGMRGWYDPSNRHIVTLDDHDVERWFVDRTPKFTHYTMTNWWSSAKHPEIYLDDALPNKPAVEYPNGRKEWWYHGLRHRLDGPAVIDPTGSKEWWVLGQPVVGVAPTQEHLITLGVRYLLTNPQRSEYVLLDMRPPPVSVLRKQFVEIYQAFGLIAPLAPSENMAYIITHYQSFLKGEWTLKTMYEHVRWPSLT